MYVLRPAFRSYGRNFLFHPGDIFSYKTIEVGHNVFIGNGAHISSTHGRITIGNDVMMGPGVTIIGGNHVTSQVGVPMARADRKERGSDPDLHIGDDAWLGARCVLLPGSSVGEGAIVTAGAVVSQPVAPYSIVAGVPARHLRDRFTKEELAVHLARRQSTEHGPETAARGNRDEL